MLRAELLQKLGRRVHSWIDVSPKSPLRLPQRFYDIVKGRIPDNEKIDVALRAQFAACRGAEHKSDLNTVRQRKKCLSEYVGQAGRLGKQLPQFRKDRRISIRLEVHLPTVHGACQQSRGRQLFEFALYSAHRRACVANDLTKVVRLICVSEQPPEHASTGTAKEQRGCIHVGTRLCCCSHRGNKCTHRGNDVNGSARLREPKFNGSIPANSRGGRRLRKIPVDSGVHLLRPANTCLPPGHFRPLHGVPPAVASAHRARPTVSQSRGVWRHRQSPAGRPRRGGGPLMDLARDDLAPSCRCPPGRSGRRRRPRRAPVGFGPVTAAPLPARLADNGPLSRDRRPPQAPIPRTHSATVEELSQIPGAREALANYIGILQEWSSRADEGGAAP